jgi:hypothetical protein
MLATSTFLQGPKVAGSPAERSAIRPLHQRDPGARVVAHRRGLILRPRRGRDPGLAVIGQVAV